MKIRTGFTFCLVLWCMLILLGCSKENNAHQDAQIELAKELGVKIEDYPNPAVFPVPYFNKNLNSGDPIEKVHNLIKGYAKVYHCDNYAEFYYFFSTDSSKALRFLVLYDNSIRYKEIITESTDSSYLDQNGCVTDGLIPNN